MAMGSTFLRDQSGPDVFALNVELAAEPSVDLLIMASILHRRGVSVLEAQLTKPEGGRRMFTVSFAASSTRQATTVARTFEGRVGVLRVQLLPALANAHDRCHVSA